MFLIWDQANRTASHSILMEIYHNYDANIPDSSPSSITKRISSIKDSDNNEDIKTKNKVLINYNLWTYQQWYHKSYHTHDQCWQMNACIHSCHKCHFITKQLGMAHPSLRNILIDITLITRQMNSYSRCIMHKWKLWILVIHSVPMNIQHCTRSRMN